MGLKLVHIYLLGPVLAMGRQNPDAKVLLLGKQDLYFTYDQIAAFLSTIGAEYTQVPPPDRRTTDSFGFVGDAEWPKYANYLHQETLFRMFGFKPENVHTLDVDTYEGAEIVHDLNDPIPAEHRGIYDLVIDCGTVEHVFNLRQAFWNFSDLVKTGGSVFHLSPVNMLEHGFFNLNATLLDDFYLQSGWAREEACYVVSPVADVGDNIIFSKVKPGELEVPPGEHYIGLLGRYTKVTASDQVTPKQGAYLGIHGAWSGKKTRQRVDAVSPSKAASRSFLTWVRYRIAVARAVRAIKRLPGEPSVIRAK